MSFFTTCFGIEAALKIVATGFIINGRFSYLRSTWNCADFFIFLVSAASLSSIGGSGFGFMKVLRLVRVLRPLRMIQRNEGLKIAVLCLFNSIMDVFNVIIISILFFALFAIFGVNYFKGAFKYCEIPIDPEEVVTKWDCYNLGGSWVNRDKNFDHLARAMLTLFEMSTTEGWFTVMYNGIDATIPNYSEEKDNSKPWAIFFIIFILFGSLFIMNLFVGVVISTFKKEKHKIDNNEKLTETQKEWIKV